MVDVLDHVEDGDVPLPAVVAEVAGEEVDHDQAPDLRHPLQDVIGDIADIGAHGPGPGVREDHGSQRGVHHLDDDPHQIINICQFSLACLITSLDTWARSTSMPSLFISRIT